MNGRSRKCELKLAFFVLTEHGGYVIIKSKTAKEGIKMRYSNIHSHTAFSDGEHSVEENIKAAIAKGMISLGISDHCYTSFDTSYCIRASELDAYKSEVRGLQKKYADQIEIYLGIELDGFAELRDRADYDYVIGDCHYVATPDGYRAIDLSREAFGTLMRDYFDGDAVKLARSYYASYAECISKMRPDMLGHIDLCTKYGLVDESDQRYIKAAREALAASLEVCPFIELNTGAMSRGYRKEPYPAVFLLDEVKARGGSIVLSSDSHSADALTYWFDEALGLLRSRGIKSIAVYKGGGFEEMGI